MNDFLDDLLLRATAPATASVHPRPVSRFERVDSIESVAVTSDAPDDTAQQSSEGPAPRAPYPGRRPRLDGAIPVPADGPVPASAAPPTAWTNPTPMLSTASAVPPTTAPSYASVLLPPLRPDQEDPIGEMTAVVDATGHQRASHTVDGQPSATDGSGASAVPAPPLDGHRESTQPRDGVDGGVDRGADPVGDVNRGADPVGDVDHGADPVRDANHGAALVRDVDRTSRHAAAPASRRTSAAVPTPDTRATAGVPTIVRRMVLQPMAPAGASHGQTRSEQAGERPARRATADGHPSGVQGMTTATPASLPAQVDARPAGVRPAGTVHRPAGDSMLHPAPEPLPPPAPAPTASSPDVHITIGRVEVRATTAAHRPAARPRPTAPVMSLDEYLASRDRRDR